MKLEIEHIQHLLGQAGHRLRRDFEHWYVNVYLATETPTSAAGNDDVNSDSAYGSVRSRSALPSPLASSVSEEREVSNGFDRSRSRAGDAGLLGHAGRRSYGSSSSFAGEKQLSAPNDGASAVASIKRAQELLSQLEGSESFASAPDLFHPAGNDCSTKPSPSSESFLSTDRYLGTPPPVRSSDVGSAPFNGGSRASSRASAHPASVSEDIEAFYKAREGLLRRVSGT